MRTHEGGKQYEHSLDHALEFFSKAGSLFDKRESFYSGDESALSLFQKTWIVDKELSMKLLFWLRDCRGGAGNRSGARSIYKWLADNDPEWIVNNINMIPEVGRWDDLRSFFGTKAQYVAVDWWCSNLEESNILAAKWADRKDIPIYLDLKHRHSNIKNIGDFRRFLANIRKENIVEHKMCQDRWDEIEYHTVPSLAMARYTNAFGNHDTKRFDQFKENLKEGKVDIKASVLFPHDCVRTVMNGDYEIAEAQFDALPNYLGETDEKIIVLSDTSASMRISVSGSVSAKDISQGLALYCSAKIPEDNPFYKKFIGFCSEGRFKDWNGMSISDAILNRREDHGRDRIFDTAVGSTQIDKALMLILDTAKFFKLSQEYMPTTLLIVSDMQFHSGVDGDGTEVEKCLKLWNDSGYNTPKIVYWNTAGYTGSPDTAMSNNIALVSGFSPAILKAIFAGDDFTPSAVMLRALDKYKIVVP